MLSAGQIDTSFGDGGRVLTSFSGGSAEISHVASTSDGRVVAVGFYKSDAGVGLALARYELDGTLDRSFGSGGTVSMLMTGQVTSILSVAVAHDGKIVIAWEGENGVFESFVSRFKSSGSLDSNFGRAGTSGSSIAVSSMTLANDGGVLLGGYVNPLDPSTSAGPVAAVERFLPTGFHDATFGTKGLYRFSGSLASNFSGTIRVLRQGSDGAITAIEQHYWTTFDPGDPEDGEAPEDIENYSYGIHRLNRDKASAIVDTPSSPGFVGADFFEAGAILADGSATFSTEYYGVKHFDASGNLDPNYFHSYDEVGDLLDGSNYFIPTEKGKLLAGALTGLGNNAYRFNANGTLDPTFGVNGNLAIPFSTFNLFDGIESMDGSLWLAGSHKGEFALLRVWTAEGPIADAQPGHRSSSAPTTQKIAVTYRDDSGLDSSTIDRNDIRVYLPDGTSRPVSLFAMSSSDGIVTATYAFSAPGGSWDATDNGEYIVRVKGEQVADTDGNYMEGRAIGAFVVYIS